MVAAAAPGLSLPGSPAQWALRTRGWSLGSYAPGGTRLVNSPDNGEMPWHVGHLSGALSPIVTVMEKARTKAWHVAARGDGAHGGASGRLGSVVHPAAGECGYSAEDVTSGVDPPVLSTVDKSENILWHHYPVGRLERQRLLGQRGCVVWITGLSGSGKSTLSCALSRELHARGYLSYILDGDNLRHGLNKNLSFSPTDRAENIRKIGEVAKLFADAGVICIASLISPYRRDRDACRALFPEATFIEVFLDMPLEVCELRDPKGLYKLARAGKIKGFTGIDDPYEPPQKCEITIQQVDGFCPSPATMVEQVLSFMEMNGYLQPDCNPSMVSC